MKKILLLIPILLTIFIFNNNVFGYSGNLQLNNVVAWNLTNSGTNSTFTFVNNYIPAVNLTSLGADNYTNYVLLFDDTDSTQKVFFLYLTNSLVNITGTSPLANISISSRQVSLFYI